MNNRYYVMRHGESIANRQGIIVSRASHALEDYGLTSRGAEQVMNTASQTRLTSATIIISSDYLRARASAEIVSCILSSQQAIIYDARLRERNFGSWELKSDENYSSVWRLDETRKRAHDVNVESVDSVLQRELNLIDELEKTYQGQTLLLVGHGDPLQILLAWYQGRDPYLHRQISSLGNADIRGLPRPANQQKTA